MANSPSGESVINRVVRLLAAFGADRQDKRLREIARQVDLPVSTVHRLLGELELEGVVIRDDHGRWRHGHRLWEIASRGSRAHSLRDAALGPMEDLLDSLQAHVAFGVLEGSDVLYIERISPEDDTIVNIAEAAGRLPAHACSPGLVMTAFGPVRQQEVMLRRRLKKFTDQTVTDPNQLRALFAQIRRDGYVSMPGIIVPQSTGIAVPVFGGEGEVIAALSIIAPRGGEGAAVAIPQLAFASRSITRRLGFDIRTPHRRVPMNSFSGSFNETPSSKQA